MSASDQSPVAPPALTLPEALARAHAHWTAGQAAQAEQLCQRILAVHAEQPDALHLLGLMAYAYGRLDKAVDLLRRVCAAPHVAASYLSDFAEMCRQRGLLEEGEAAARRAVTQAPDMAAGWNNLGIILQEMGRYAESRACLEKVLAMQPENPEILNNLGNTCSRQGETVLAERYWRQALALKPDYAKAHSNLAKLLAERRQYDEALELGRRAIALDPQFADAYINLAALEMERGRYPEALKWLDALLAVRADHAVALAARALVLGKLERPTEALASAEEAVRHAPNNAEGQYAYGSALQALGRPQEALAAYERAATCPGTKAEDALVARAVLFMEQGRKREAEEAFERALARFPQSVNAWYSWADLKKFGPGDPLIPRMQALFDRGEDLLPQARMALHFALGKAYLDAGDSVQAFWHLDRGNAQKRATFTYEAAATSRFMADIADVFSRDLFAHRPGAGAESSRPVFVVGMPRSGTTLTEQILASHHAVCGAGELSHLQRVVAGIADYPHAVRRATAGAPRTWGEAYLECVTPLAQGALYVVDKMPANFLHAGFIHLALPQARIIHCRRNAVDTCLSCYSKLFSGEQRFSYNQEELGRFYRDYERLMDHWRAVLPPTHFLEVDYEAIVEDLETEARRMLTFLGLDWDPACLEFHKTKRAVRTASVNQVREPIYKTSAGRWRAHAQQLQPLLTALGLDEPI